MSDAVLVAIITGGISIAGIIITAVFQMLSTRSKIEEGFRNQATEIQRQSEIADMKLQAKLENFQALTNERIEDLTREVRKHNDFATRVPILEEKMKRTDHRLEGLEKMSTRAC